MAKYKAYSEYKDSGVEWLGDIPTHWVCTALKRLCSLTTGLTPPTQNEENYADEGYPWVRPEDINEHGLETRASKYVSDTGWKLLRHIEPNSTLICCIGTIGKCGYVRETVSTNQQITAATFRNHERYYFYLMQAARTQLEELATGNVLKILNSERLGALNVIKVEGKESDTIAEFLDHETAKIDNLIENQQQLIELLKEKRQAVISHAVTKGLNPDVPMKDSGVEWLGEVPEHWIVRRLKHTSSLQSGIPKGKDLTGKNSISVPMLRVANVQDGYLDLDDVHSIDIEPSQLGRYLLRDGDVLMNEGGDNDQLGRGAVWTAPINNCIHQNHVFAIRPNSIEPEWLDMLTRAAYAKFHFYRVAKQSTNLASISSTNIKETPLLVPPKKERDEILKFVDFQLKKIKATEELSIKQVVLLQERRTALISAAVTGKIDVRNWAAPDTSDIEASEEATA
ncbi:restriction endonuclease subunit S [Buttiauxella selenatireducens]|uniref:Restriction endonuclease subunit S n=1 Tax=Buttiauxella selenatireducens TaxID=3073902 RepID=A0ABY9S9Z6_9ENTR|nr:restriction endonuclease subunit S [Buttiauxella sp. R73]WMY73808.1 restriction endonuclease subunit S [Buttiauxella sp. R73]